MNVQNDARIRSKRVYLKSEKLWLWLGTEFGINGEPTNQETNQHKSKERNREKKLFIDIVFRCWEKKKQQTEQIQFFFSVVYEPKNHHRICNDNRK